MKGLKDMRAHERGDYVRRQGWAKMPGEKEAGSHEDRRNRR
jgi:hypothetical protein